MGTAVLSWAIFGAEGKMVGDTGTKGGFRVTVTHNGSLVILLYHCLLRWIGDECWLRCWSIQDDTIVCNLSYGRHISIPVLDIRVVLCYG